MLSGDAGTTLLSHKKADVFPIPAALRLLTERLVMGWEFLLPTLEPTQTSPSLVQCGISKNPRLSAERYALGSTCKNSPAINLSNSTEALTVSSTQTNCFLFPTFLKEIDQLLTSTVRAMMLSLAARHTHSLEISLNGILTKLVTMTGVRPRGPVGADPPRNAAELPQKRTEVAGAMAGLWRSRNKGL